MNNNQEKNNDRMKEIIYILEFSLILYHNQKAKEKQIHSLL